jgi:dTDP-4-amino-4,6-dideoxygalactose transaminase
MYPIVLRGEAKTGLVNFLEQGKVETRDIMPLINQPVYVKRFGDLERRYPTAAWINKSGFYVGCHQYLSRQELDHVLERIHAYFGR